MTLLTSGALIGVAVVMMLDPRTRQSIWRSIEGVINNVLGPVDEEHGIEQEAAATEGGLAGTREWQKAVATGR
jgi:hypothetical protein